MNFLFELFYFIGKFVILDTSYTSISPRDKQGVQDFIKEDAPPGPTLATALTCNTHIYMINMNHPKSYEILIKFSNFRQSVLNKILARGHDVSDNEDFKSAS